jgi:hypothetical protein
MTMPPDGAGVLHFPVHAQMPETATQDDLRAVIGMTLDYLGLTWKLHEKVLDILSDSDNRDRPEPADGLRTYGDFHQRAQRGPVRRLWSRTRRSDV